MISDNQCFVYINGSVAPWAECESKCGGDTMARYRFYYDESEHSRKINLNTVSAVNYYDNFISVIVGWKDENQKSVFEKYASFEEKYADRKSKGELKSQTLKQDQFEYGFASMNKSNVCFLNDLLSVFDNDIMVYFAVLSKIEFIISQIFDGYKNSILCDMDAMKYSIIKAILVYQPKEIIEQVFENTGELVKALKAFFVDKIQQNKENVSLKQKEIEAFEEILMILDDIENVKTIEWNYSIAFAGFKKYLAERSIDDFTLTIDKEGESSKTLNAARHMGFDTAIEADSKCSIGIRISDMMAGVLSKMLKALCNSLRYNSSDEQIQKKLLGSEWFMLNNEQLGLYKKLYVIICKYNNAWYKSYSGIYSDDLIVLTALLDYMNHFSSPEEIRQNIDMQGEYFNSYACHYLSDYFERMKNKLPIDPVPLDSKEYFFNQRGAKVFFDIQKQPILRILDGSYKYNVLSVGFSKEGIPLATIVEHEQVYCYRLPDDLSEWTMTAVGYANMGMNLFPAEVIFTKRNGKFYADIL